MVFFFSEKRVPLSMTVIFYLILFILYFTKQESLIFKNLFYKNDLAKREVHTQIKLYRQHKGLCPCDDCPSHRLRCVMWRWPGLPWILPVYYPPVGDMWKSDGLWSCNKNDKQHQLQNKTTQVIWGSVGRAVSSRCFRTLSRYYTLHFKQTSLGNWTIWTVNCKAR